MTAARPLCDLCAAPFLPSANRPDWPRCAPCTLTPAHARLDKRGPAPAYAVPSATPDAVTWVTPGSPLSVNRVYRLALRNGRRIMFFSQQGKAYKVAVAAHALQALGLVRWDRTRRYSVELLAYFQSDRADADNIAKPALDALQGVLFDNDRQVESVTCAKALDRLAPRLVATVRAI